MEEKNVLQKQLEKLEAKELTSIRKELLTIMQNINGTNFIGENVEVSNADALRKICFELKNDLSSPYMVCLTANIGGKPNVAILISEDLNFEAPKLIKEHVAPLIKGGGGGQKTFASAGGTDASTLRDVITTIKQIL
jgi:alanyl-tRNA synthetase